MEDNILYLKDSKGTVHGVFVPIALWLEIQKSCGSVLKSITEQDDTPEPMDAFAEFLAYWDFPYPYDPAVHCPHCGAETSNWRNDPLHPFKLANASFGGLLVFHCRKCGTTIRHKHFKDHVCHEHTVPNESK